MIDCNETQVGCRLPWDRTLWSHNQTCTTIQQYRWVWLDWAGGDFHPTVQVEDSNTDNSDPVQSSIWRFAIAFFKSEQEIWGTLQQPNRRGFGWDLQENRLPQALPLYEVLGGRRQKTNSLQIRELLVRPRLGVQRHFCRDGAADLPLDIARRRIWRNSQSFSWRVVYVAVGWFLFD